MVDIGFKGQKKLNVTVPHLYNTDSHFFGNFDNAFQHFDLILILFLNHPSSPPQQALVLGVITANFIIDIVKPI
jgi:hypothetical protein